MLDKNGKIEADITVCRVGEHSFYLVVGTSTVSHNLFHIRRYTQGMQIKVFDVTGTFAILSLMGPKSREVLSTLTDTSLTNDCFPFGTFQEIYVGGHLVRALRVSYVGELGWELHIPTDTAVMVYNCLIRAGEPHGIRNSGYRAIWNLRMEKRYLSWGHDISNKETPLEANLGFAVKLNTKVEFLGREALENQKKQGVRKRLVQFTIDDSSVSLFGGENIYRNGELVGDITSGGYSYTLSKGLGLGYVSWDGGKITTDYLKNGIYEIDTGAQRVPAQISLEVLYDPKGHKMRS